MITAVLDAVDSDWRPKSTSPARERQLAWRGLYSAPGGDRRKLAKSMALVCIANLAAGRHRGGEAAVRRGQRNGAARSSPKPAVMTGLSPARMESNSIIDDASSDYSMKLVQQLAAKRPVGGGHTTLLSMTRLDSPWLSAAVVHRRNAEVMGQCRSCRVSSSTFESRPTPVANRLKPPPNYRLRVYRRDWRGECTT